MQSVHFKDKQKTPFIDIAIVNSVTYVVSLIHESYWT